MIFLIEYNRPKGRIVTIREFADGEREQAADARLQLELGLNREKVAHEVVLLEAGSKNALKKTHRRYFASVAEIASGMMSPGSTKVSGRGKPRG